MKKDRRGINPASKPSGDGCVECLASPKGWWFHLRRCAKCGHIGCCDSSPSQHASEHAAATGHPVIASFEPGEDWFFDYEKQGMINGVSCFRGIRIRRINQRLDRQGEFQRIGNRCCTSWRRSFEMRSLRKVRAWQRSYQLSDRQAGRRWQGPHLKVMCVCAKSLYPPEINRAELQTAASAVWMAASRSASLNGLNRNPAAPCLSIRARIVSSF